MGCFIIFREAWCVVRWGGLFAWGEEVPKCQGSKKTRRGVPREGDIWSRVGVVAPMCGEVRKRAASAYAVAFVDGETCMSKCRHGVAFFLCYFFPSACGAVFGCYRRAGMRFASFVCTQSSSHFFVAQMPVKTRTPVPCDGLLSCFWFWFKSHMVKRLYRKVSAPCYKWEKRTTKCVWRPSILDFLPS